MSPSPPAAGLVAPPTRPPAATDAPLAPAVRQQSLRFPQLRSAHWSLTRSATNFDRGCGGDLRQERDGGERAAIGHEGARGGVLSGRGEEVG